MTNLKDKLAASVRQAKAAQQTSSNRPAQKSAPQKAVAKPTAKPVPKAMTKPASKPVVAAQAKPAAVKKAVTGVPSGFQSSSSVWPD